MIFAMRIAPFGKALLLAAAACGVAGALVAHNGVGAVEWLVGAAIAAVLGAGAMYFARLSFTTT
jgi:hypothetical protein